MTAIHTNGPWEVWQDRDGEDFKYTVSTKTSGIVVAECQFEKDAHSIAAVPEMLAALEKAEYVLRHCVVADGFTDGVKAQNERTRMEAKEAVCAAIAKASGVMPQQAESGVPMESDTDSEVIEAGPYYEFVASYHYRDGEQYNGGRGLQASSQDLKHLNGVFDSFLKRDDGYALVLRRCDTGEVLRSHGDTKAAQRSMHAAYRLRYPRSE